MSKSEIGSIGENFFELLASKAGLIVNYARRDKAGWDFKVDFQHPDHVNLSALHEAIPQCLVQVKTSRKHKKAATIKLSNAYRHAIAPEPVFLVLILLDATNQVSKCFVKLFDDILIKRTLARVASEKEKGNTKLHLRKLTISFEEQSELIPITGEQLLARLEKEIGPNFGRFISQRSRLLSQLGYEDPQSSTVQFQVNSRNQFSTLVKVSLGIEDSVQLSNFQREEKRFGVVDEEKSIRGQTAMLSMPKLQPRSVGTVRLARSKYDAPIEIPAKLFATPFYEAAPPDEYVIRVNTCFFDLMFKKSLSDARFDLKFDHQASLPFAEVLNYAQLLRIVANPPGNLWLSMKFDQMEPWTTEGSFSNDATQSWMLEDADLIEHTHRLLQEFSAPPSTAVCLGEILLKKTEIPAFLKVFTHSPMKVEFTANTDTLRSGEKISYLTGLSLAIGDLAIVVIVIVRGEVSSDQNQKFCMFSSNYEVLDRFTARLPDKELLPTVRSKCKNHYRSLKRREKVIVDGDLDWES